MYIGEVNGNIAWLSDTPVPGAISLPLELQTIDPKVLIRDYKVINGEIHPRVKAIPSKIALISTYNTNCGIATYSQYLTQALLDLNLDVHVFATLDQSIKPDPTHVTRCWERAANSHNLLVQEIKEFSPDLIIIQHEFGLFHNLAAWNSLLARLCSEFRVITCLHTVLEHRVPDLETSDDYRTRFLAEIACPEVIVHNKKAIECLRERGYSGRIHYIPHGCHKPGSLTKLPANKYQNFSNNLIFQYGFGGEYKGWDTVIEALPAIKSQVPDVYYLGVYNVLKEHDLNYIKYYESLQEKAIQLDVSWNMALHYGYQSDEMLLNIARSAKLAVYPYRAPTNWYSWGASGAIQLPLSLGLPLVLGDYPAFEDFRDRMLLVKDHEELATEVTRICLDEGYCAERTKLSLALAEERSWDKVAHWYINLPRDNDFEAL